MTSCPCSVPHSDGDAAETPGVCQLHRIARTGYFWQPQFLGWAKRLESLLMASAVTKHCSVQLICTSCLLQKACERLEEELWKKSERKTKELILPDLSENLFCTVVLTGPSFAYLTCKWHGNTCNWGLWRLDDCEDEMFLFLFAKVPTLHPQDQVAWILYTKVRLHLDQLAWMQNVMYKMVLRIQP